MERLRKKRMQKRWLICVASSSEGLRIRGVYMMDGGGGEAAALDGGYSGKPMKCGPHLSQRVDAQTAATLS